MKYINRELIDRLFETINGSNIDYILIDGEWVDELLEIPEGSYLELLIKSEDYEKIHNYLYEKDYLFPKNIYGTETGWMFTDNLSENIYAKIPRAKQDLYLLINDRLCCHSPLSKTWISLNQCINDRAWNEKVWNEKKNCWHLDQISRFVYLIVKSIFDKKNFSKNVKIFFDDNKKLLDDQHVIALLEHIFFLYTDRLVYMMKSSSYDKIVKDYISFSNY